MSRVRSRLTSGTAAVALASAASWASVDYTLGSEKPGNPSVGEDLFESEDEDEDEVCESADEGEKVDITEEVVVVIYESVFEVDSTLCDLDCMLGCVV